MYGCAMCGAVVRCGVWLASWHWPTPIIVTVSPLVALWMAAAPALLCLISRLLLVGSVVVAGGERGCSLVRPLLGRRQSVVCCPQLGCPCQCQANEDSSTAAEMATKLLCTLYQCMARQWPGQVSAATNYYLAAPTVATQ